MGDLVQTEIGTIAPDWELVELGSCADPPQYGLTARADTTGNVKFLRITDLTDLGVDWAHVPNCHCSHDDIQRYSLSSGDIVFARIGATTGKSHLISGSPRAVFASYLIKIRPKPVISPEFLSHFFHSQGYWAQVDSYKNANLKKGMSASLLKRLLIPKPPLLEQKKIAYVLSSVQRAIEQQDRIIALTTELKKALINELFTQGLRGEPQKETEIGPVPEGWRVLNLGSLARKVSKGSSPR